VTEQRGRLIHAILVIIAALLGVGVLVAMWLSGVSTRIE
jgi:hypothetical protein